MRSPAVLILAAGQGKRMKSDRAKVLHEICGLPMIHYTIQTAQKIAQHSPFLVVGHQAESVKSALGNGFVYIEQSEQKGTGHAVLQAENYLKHSFDEVVVLCGDTPLLSAETLMGLIEARRARNAGCSVLTVKASDPSGYGRIVRSDVDPTVVHAIVEHNDADPEQLLINEINSGVYCFDVKQLYDALPALTTQNAQHEYYLTDVVRLFGSRGIISVAHCAEDPREALGVNDRKQLATISALIKNRVLDGLMLEGVTIEDAASTFIDASVRIGRDTVIKPFTFIHGDTMIGEGCTIGPQTTINDSQVGDRVGIYRSVVEQSVIHSDVEIGPFAHLRPANVVHSRAKIGNYAELKNTVVHEGAKVPHHCYAGDCVIGKGVNYSAGVITVNYDGVKKHQTVIEDGAFVGCNANLIAPVTIGKGAYVAAGSTVNADVPEHSLAIARQRQINKEDWALTKGPRARALKDQGPDR